MKKLYVVGNPVEHSKSPEIHNHWLKKYNQDYQYEKLKLSLDDKVFVEQKLNLIKKIRKGEIKGINITVPFKTKFIDTLDEIDDSAKLAKAVNTIYKDYFLSINPEILEENLNINLNKVELGITPEEYRDQGIDFFIGTSGGGFEILVQSKLISECSEDRITCQHVRVKKELLENFLATLLNYDKKNISKFVIESNCIDIKNTNISHNLLSFISLLNSEILVIIQSIYLLENKVIFYYHVRVS